MAEADVILVVGTPFDFRLGYGKSLNPAAKVIQIDQNYSVIGKNRDVELGLLGHAGTIFRAVVDAVSGSEKRKMATKRKEWIAMLRSAEAEALEN